MGDAIEYVALQDMVTEAGGLGLDPRLYGLRGEEC